MVPSKTDSGTALKSQFTSTETCYKLIIALSLEGRYAGSNFAWNINI